MGLRGGWEGRPYLVIHSMGYFLLRGCCFISNQNMTQFSRGFGPCDTFYSSHFLIGKSWIIDSLFWSSLRNEVFHFIQHFIQHFTQHLVKLNHFPGRMRPQTKLTPKIEIEHHALVKLEESFLPMPFVMSYHVICHIMSYQVEYRKLICVKILLEVLRQEPHFFPSSHNFETLPISYSNYVLGCWDSNLWYDPLAKFFFLFFGPSSSPYSEMILVS